MPEGQILLLRFAYAKDSPRRHKPSPLKPPHTPSPLRHPPLGGPSPSSEKKEATPSHDRSDETFRPESWHVSREKGGLGTNSSIISHQQRGKGARELARSVSPPHSGHKTATATAAIRADSGGILVAGGLARGAGDGLRRSKSQTFDTAKESSARLILTSSETPSSAGDGAEMATGRKKAGKAKDATTAGLEGKLGLLDMSRRIRMGRGLQQEGKRTRELWGEHGTGFSEGDSRHVYLGDMGHAKAQRTLGAIAQDVQVCVLV